MSYYQNPDVSNVEYRQQFKARMESIDDYGEEFLVTLMPAGNKLKEEFGTTHDEVTDEENAAKEEMFKKETQAAFMLYGADRH